MLYHLTKLSQTVSSPNHVKGRAGHAVQGIVIHKAEGTLAGTLSWFAVPQSQVSAHYVIGLDGRVVNVVDPDDQAWHSGVVVKPTAIQYKAGVNPNLYTVGIELEGFAAHGTPSVQLAALIDLVTDLTLAYKITPSDTTIAYHREYDADKSCPGYWIDKEFVIKGALQNAAAIGAGVLPV